MLAGQNELYSDYCPIVAYLFHSIANVFNQVTSQFEHREHVSNPFVNL
jgi:hypothetical protein